MRRYYLLAGQRLAMRDASGTSYLLSDHIGSVVAVLDGSGAVVGEQRYKPFGQPRLTPGIGQTDVGFSGQRSLAAAGLQDFNARWLDSSLGMFAAPDSLIANPYNPQSLNPYGYVMNNPLRYTDPTGLYVFKEAPTDKYVSVSDPRVRYASKTSESKALAPAPKPATSSPSAPGATGGVQEGTGAIAPANPGPTGNPQSPEGSYTGPFPDQLSRELRWLSKWLSLSDLYSQYASAFAPAHLQGVSVEVGTWRATVGAAVLGLRGQPVPAFTLGQRIYFRTGAFDPRTPTGVGLIAHEVLHTKQFEDAGAMRFAYQYTSEMLRARSLDVYTAVAYERKAAELQVFVRQTFELVESDPTVWFLTEKEYLLR